MVYGSSLVMFALYCCSWQTSQELNPVIPGIFAVNILWFKSPLPIFLGSNSSYLPAVLPGTSIITDGAKGSEPSHSVFMLASTKRMVSIFQSLYAPCRSSCLTCNFLSFFPGTDHPTTIMNCDQAFLNFDHACPE